MKTDSRLAMKLSIPVLLAAWMLWFLGAIVWGDSGMDALTYGMATIWTIVVFSWTTIGIWKIETGSRIFEIC